MNYNNRSVAPPSFTLLSGDLSLHLSFKVGPIDGQSGGLLGPTEKFGLACVMF